MKFLWLLLFFMSVMECCAAVITGDSSSVVCVLLPFFIVTVLYALNVREKRKCYKKTSRTIPKEAKKTWEKSLLKAIEDHNTLQKLKKQIADGEIAWQLGNLQEVAGKILKYLDKNTEQIPEAEEFIEIYQDKTVVLIHQYLSLEKVKYSCAKMDESKLLIKKMLSSLLETYKKEFEKILNSRFMDFNAEINVFQQFINHPPI